MKKILRIGPHKICPNFVFTASDDTLYNAMSQALAKNAAHLWYSTEFHDVIALRKNYSRHPTQSSRYQFFAQKVARAIYDAKSRTYITPDIRTEANFLIHVLSNPNIYKWESPITHLIPREFNAELYNNACPKGAGGFSSDYDYWWTEIWPLFIYQRTCLPPTDSCFLSINLLEYAALIFGLAGAIVAWESLPTSSRPPHHPVLLLWTDNMSAKAWTKKVSSMKTPQGRSLAHIFAHLLMFSDVGIEAAHIQGEKNIIADYLSCISHTHKFSSFTYANLQTQFPWLTLSRHFLPSSKLHLLVCTALSRQSVSIPTTRVKLRQMQTEPNTLKQPFLVSQNE
jgi:hypothetical protein